MLRHQVSLARTLICVLPLLFGLGCSGADLSQGSQAKVNGVTTQPAGRDLDREGLQMVRPLSALGAGTIRIYESGAGYFVADERYTLNGQQALLEYLAGQESKRLRQGVLYFISKGRIDEVDGFAAVKAFAIEHNVNLYVAHVTNAAKAWASRRPVWADTAVVDEVSWIVQARP